ncbi:MAG: PIG-L family deacetylase [Firmicutes bacterium]|nr:PIG-L family deacetylase [Bacillota bacterium]
MPETSWYPLNSGGDTGPVLVVAPHPDDEVLGCGGLIARWRARGVAVTVVLVTLGDGFRENAVRYYLRVPVQPHEFLHLGYERQAECLAALQALGVEEERVIALGFPDGGLIHLLTDRWQNRPWRSPTTGASAVPYWTAQAWEVPYTGSALVEQLASVMAAVRPRTMVVPHPWDQHPDHWATQVFSQVAWLKAGLPEANWLGYLIHWPRWPRLSRAFPWPPKGPPSRLRERRWWRHRLEPELKEAKWRALSCYQSQRELILPFMRAMCGWEEWFGLDFRWDLVGPSQDTWGVGLQLREAAEGRRCRVEGADRPVLLNLWEGPDCRYRRIALEPDRSVFLSSEWAVAAAEVGARRRTPALRLAGGADPRA